MSRDRPVLRSFGDLSVADFRTHPVWVGVHTVDYDEPWYEDTDEETFRPYDGPLPLDPAKAMYLIAATASLADGSTLPGFYFLTPADEAMKDLDQPHLLCNGKAWSFYAGMWGFRESYEDELCEALNRTPQQIFPIQFTPVEGVADPAAPRLITGLQGGGHLGPRPKRSWFRRVFGIGPSSSA